MQVLPHSFLTAQQMVEMAEIRDPHLAAHRPAALRHVATARPRQHRPSPQRQEQQQQQQQHADLLASLSEDVAEVLVPSIVYPAPDPHHHDSFHGGNHQQQQHPDGSPPANGRWHSADGGGHGGNGGGSGDGYRFPQADSMIGEGPALMDSILACGSWHSLDRVLRQHWRQLQGGHLR